MRRRKPQVLLEEHQRCIDDVLLGREGGAVWGKQKHNGVSITNLLRVQGRFGVGTKAEKDRSKESRVRSSKKPVIAKPLSNAGMSAMLAVNNPGHSRPR